MDEAAVGVAAVAVSGTDAVAKLTADGMLEAVAAQHGKSAQQLAQVFMKDKDLKLPKDWVVQIVKQVGNYGEVFEKNLGQSTDLKIDRGMNALWNNGGIQYAPPVR